MRIVKEGWPFIIGSPLVCGAVAGIAHYMGLPVIATAIWVLGLVLLAFMVYFFRDPERTSPADPALLVSGADGVVRTVEQIEDPKYLGVPAVRISVFLNPFNVHVNRTPIGGKVTGLRYVPGRHMFTMSNESSEHNEHSEIRIAGAVPCLVTQIVGPVVRRVIYWYAEGQEIQKGERLGLMKFGSRMDVYFPQGAVEVLVRPGDKVRAGESPIARITGKV
ncbi:MAG: phosphatidylserine decarboxylase [Kiritimatiellia bacterium]